MTLRSVASPRRRPVLPDLSPTAERLEPQPGAHNLPPGPAADVVPQAAGRIETAAPAPRPAGAQRPAVGGARLDSLLSSLIANAPQVPPEAAVDPKAESSRPRADDERTESAPPRARARFPWRFALGIAGAALMGAVALVGVRGMGARLAAPGRTLDGARIPRAPGTNYDAWLAAAEAAGERVM